MDTPGQKAFQAGGDTSSTTKAQQPSNPNEGEPPPQTGAPDAPAAAAGDADGAKAIAQAGLVGAIMDRVMSRMKGSAETAAMFAKAVKILKLILGLIPQPMLMIIMVAVCMVFSAAATAKSSKKNCWGFVICYTASTVVVASSAAIVYLYVMGTVPTAALASLLMSPLGVWASVTLDRMFMTIDNKAVREREAQSDAVMRKLIFLHGVYGVGLAVVIQCIPSVCPLVPSE